MGKKLWSAFTDDMEHCFFTGSAPAERHHIFGASNRNRSEKYGYVVPLSPTLHPNGSQAGHMALVIDGCLKRMAQRDYESKYGTREDFIREFGKNYL